MMAISNKPWDGSASNYPNAESYCNASLFNGNTGPASGWTKAACSLPVYEPNGDLNINGVRAAANALAGARTPLDLTGEQKRKAAVALLGLYRKANITPPGSLTQMANGAMNSAIRGRLGR